MNTLPWNTHRRLSSSIHAYIHGWLNSSTPFNINIKDQLNWSIGPRTITKELYIRKDDFNFVPLPCGEVKPSCLQNLIWNMYNKQWLSKECIYPLTLAWMLEIWFNPNIQLYTLLLLSLWKHNPLIVKIMFPSTWLQVSTCKKSFIVSTYFLYCFNNSYMREHLCANQWMQTFVFFLSFSFQKNCYVFAQCFDVRADVRQNSCIVNIR